MSPFFAIIELTTQFFSIPKRFPQSVSDCVLQAGRLHGADDFYVTEEVSGLVILEFKR